MLFLKLLKIPCVGVAVLGLAFGAVGVGLFMAGSYFYDRLDNR